MEFVIMLASLVGFAFFVIALEAYRARKREKEFIGELYHNYTKLSDKSYSPERFMRMGSYYERHKSECQIDDITWNDLGLDEIFKRMNYTMSASGEEYLYYMLRTLKQDRDSLEHFEKVMKCFEENPDERVRFQYKMHKLGYTGKYSLYEYIENLDYLGERKISKHLIPDLMFLPFIALLWLNFSLGIAGIVGLMMYNIISYFKEKGEIEAYITSFAYILRLLDTCSEVEKLKLTECQGELDCIKKCYNNVKSMSRGAFWVMSAGNGANLTSGDVFSILFDYIRMIFHVDLIKFDSMLKEVREHKEDIDRMITMIGYLETAVAVWIFRQSLTHGWCRPVFTEESGDNCIKMYHGYHPLIPDPVKNSIDSPKSVLLTGSNASGKSTFLKTVAVNVILSQTVNTCSADSYSSPFYTIYSSMALRDDLKNGESYYIVEIKALKRILDAADRKQRVFCFVDEVLRGTNTVERIAASAQILKSLSQKGVLCFAATHDIELTGLLEKEFDNYHFEEEIVGGDIEFNYKLQPGKASTRNAIKLLEVLGYEKEIIEKALKRAEDFMNTGEWKR